MKKNESSVIEAYFQTENEHWNKYAFKTLRKALEKQLFDDYNKLLQLYQISINIGCDTHKENPFSALQLMISEYDKNHFNTAQKIYLLDRVNEYLNRTEFDGWCSSELNFLIASQIVVFNNELQVSPIIPGVILTRNIRETLKELMKREIELLPETLNQLDSVQRINILCKLIPYVLPKIETITHKLDEPQSDIEFNSSCWQVS
jgi:hypothetical protein